jgi:hypothetical protein
MPINVPPPAATFTDANSFLKQVSITYLTDPSGSLPGSDIPRTRCYLTATVDGVVIPFETSRQKFEALSKSWNEYNFGRSIIDYHDLAFEQIVGMGAEVVPYLLERVAAGESEWIYALKCIVGKDQESPDMIGDEERVVGAWIEWGKKNVRLTGQTC